jgi:hypothetical protein
MSARTKTPREFIMSLPEVPRAIVAAHVQHSFAKDWLSYPITRDAKSGILFEIGAETAVDATTDWDELDVFADVHYALQNAAGGMDTALEYGFKKLTVCMSCWTVNSFRYNGLRHEVLHVASIEELCARWMKGLCHEDVKIQLTFAKYMHGEWEGCMWDEWWWSFYVQLCQALAKEVKVDWHSC